MGEYVTRAKTTVAGSHVSDMDGITYNQSPWPAWRHECWAQTKTVMDEGLTVVGYCPCGATSVNDEPWRSVNARRERAGETEPYPPLHPRRLGTLGGYGGAMIAISVLIFFTTHRPWLYSPFLIGGVFCLVLAFLGTSIIAKGDHRE